MNKKIFLAVTAAFLLNSTMAQAEVKTFNFTYSGAKYSNSAIATGFVTFDTINLVYNPSSRQYDFSAFGTNYSDRIIDLGMTVSGSSAGNGTFSKIDFNGLGLLFEGGTPDFSRELVGQTSSSGRYGINPGAGDSFTMFRATSSPSAPNYFDSFGIRTSGLDRMWITSITPVPEADTSAMLLIGAGVMGFMARRRKQVAA
jgi:hypothetical protein